MNNLDVILKQATDEIAKAIDLKTLEDCRVNWLGKKSRITAELKSLGQLPAEERPLVGEKINAIKQTIQALIESRFTDLNAQNIADQLASESVDLTLPGRRQSAGSLHPVTLTRERIASIFSRMGFSMMQGPEIEDDFHNFAALNIPAFHPARAMQDTFYFANGSLLRTHMSPVQVRVMKNTQPPLRIIAMGRVYRRDFDLTHTPMFHQIEGLMIDENITFANLKGILTQFLHAFFGREIPIRFRASYFPFTEPSAEVDIACQACQGKGCRICKNTGWLEVLGCGMVHPEVFRHLNIDSEKYTGWAFGAGLDRLTMLRYGISDLRALFENDLRLLQQFEGTMS
ncbi:MAG: phenylalanine--tRNA ligase subunit alpha [Gammaproteobacteria bacterium]|nr:phenylalanine--tRNA ligase subunit alpha [Gammaproteobacteria bacterium]